MLCELLNSSAQQCFSPPLHVLFLLPQFKLAADIMLSAFVKQWRSIKGGSVSPNLQSKLLQTPALFFSVDKVASPNLMKIK